ncbi:hypothetical protein ACLB2K_039523 [Fragaria x ananassa]
MKSSVRLAVLLVCLVSVFLPISHCSVPNDFKLVEETCKKTYHYDLCRFALSRVPESAHADVKGLALIMADVVLGRARNTTENKIQVLRKSNPGDKRFDDCLLHYTAIEFDIARFDEHFRNHDYTSAEVTMEDAFSQAGNCELLFDRPKSSPLHEYNILVTHLAELAGSIVLM